MLSVQATPPQKMGGTFWAVYDAVLAACLLLASSGAFSQMGGLTVFWGLTYLLFTLRVLAVFPQFVNLCLRHRILFSFAAVALLSTFWSLDRTETLISAIQLLASTCFAVFLGSRYSAKALVTFLFLMASAQVLVSMANFTTGALPVPGSDSFGRAIGIFHHKKPLTMQAVLCVLCGIGLFLVPGQSNVVRLFVVFMALICAWAAAMAQSVSLIVISMPAIMLLLVLSYRSIYRLPFFFALALGLVILAIAPIFVPLLGLNLPDIFFDATGKDISLTGRTVLWEIGLSEIAQRPILGSGFAAFLTADPFVNERAIFERMYIEVPAFHNFLVDIAVGTGVPGVIAILVVVYTVIRSTATSWSIFRSPYSAVVTTIAVFVVLVSNVTTGFATQHDLNYILAIALAVSAREDVRHLPHALRPRVYEDQGTVLVDATP